MYVSDSALGNFFENVVDELKGLSLRRSEATGKGKSLEFVELVKLASNYISSDLAGLIKNNLDIKLPNHETFARLVTMISKSELTSRAGKDILIILVKEGGDPEVIAKEKGLLAINDESAIKAVAEKVISENDKIIADYKGGKETALMALVGKVIKETKGSANPQLTKQILIDLLARP